MTATKALIGTVDFPVAKKTILRDLDAVELSATHGSPVKTGTAKKWRKEAGGDMAFSLQTPKHLFEPIPEGAPFPGKPSGYGGFSDSLENINLFGDFMKVASTLDARSIVFLTPSTFTPAKPNVEAFAKFLSTVRKADGDSGPDWVWEPKGPWEIEQAAGFAEQHNLILAVDPLRDTAPSGPSAYFRFGPFSAMGSRMGLYDLERARDAASAFESVTCVFQTFRPLDDARNLKKMWAQEFLEESAD